MARKPGYVKIILKYYRIASRSVVGVIKNSATYPVIVVVVGALIAIVLDVGGYIS